MQDHLDQFNQLILDIKNVNIDLEDGDRALILLSSLSDLYFVDTILYRRQNFVDTFLYERQTLTLNGVKNALEFNYLKKLT